jgi:hypothetical protein
MHPDQFVPALDTGPSTLPPMGWNADKSLIKHRNRAVSVKKTTIRQRAKSPTVLEVASKACTQAFGIHNPLENGFGTGLGRSLGFPLVFSPLSGR